MKASAVILSALIAGVIAGVLNSIPLVCCGLCFWLLLAGFIAVPLYQAFDKPARTLTSSQGLLLGLFAGIAAAIVASLFGLLRGSVSIDEVLAVARSYDQFDALIPYMEQASRLGGGGLIQLWSVLCNLVFYSIIGLLGGLIGAAVFKKQLN
jgi:hypothetical protein